MKNLNSLDYVAILLVVVGGINWGLVGIFQFDIVYYLFGNLPYYARLVYSIIGVAALYLAYLAVFLTKTDFSRFKYPTASLHQ